jgi:diaminohydroxyphosphoribosylaminopyrimidine deaminase / 5-amino-6-(5-phosphoribosylamino)uracil reductase
MGANEIAGSGRAGAGASMAAADIFAPFLAAPPERPFVAAQLGQSLDGRIATISGESRFINGAAALDHLHRLRAHVDAVVVGASTIAADDPQLNVRRVEGQSPARVVIDPRGRLAPGGRWLAEDGARRVVVTAAEGAPLDVEIVRLAARPDGTLDPAAIIAALFERGLKRILIEGGARTISAFIDADCVDRLHVLIAPMIIGSGKPGLALQPVPELARALRPHTSVHLLDDGDVLFDCDLRAGAR